jgi:putative flippase GtrA
LRRLRRLAASLVHWSTIRYGIAGMTAALVYLSLPVVLNGGAGVPLQIAIPVAYVAAVIVQFNLQRRFVFRHVSEFALTRRAQIGRYLMIGAVQYPLTAIATAFLPSVLGISPRATFVAVALAMSLTIFLVLRTHIFHETHLLDDHGQRTSRAELDVAQEDFRGGRRRARDREADPIKAPMK